MKNNQLGNIHLPYDGLHETPTGDKSGWQIKISLVIFRIK
jgi:hypothetical protein